MKENPRMFSSTQSKVSVVSERECHTASINHLQMKKFDSAAKIRTSQIDMFNQLAVK